MTPANDYRDYEEQPIVDALRACVTGEFSGWTMEQHQAFADWMTRHPRAIAGAACTFLDQHLPEDARLKLRDTTKDPESGFVIPPQIRRE